MSFGPAPGKRPPNLQEKRLLIGKGPQIPGREIKSRYLEPKRSFKRAATSPKQIEDNDEDDQFYHNDFGSPAKIGKNQFSNLKDASQATRSPIYKSKSPGSSQYTGSPIYSNNSKKLQSLKLQSKGDFERKKLKAIEEFERFQGLSPEEIQVEFIKEQILKRQHQQKLAAASQKITEPQQRTKNYTRSKSPQKQAGGKVKKAQYNLAAQGASNDYKGVKYSASRSVKSYQNQRKQTKLTLDKQIQESHIPQKSVLQEGTRSPLQGINRHFARHKYAESADGGHRNLNVQLKDKAALNLLNSIHQSVQSQRKSNDPPSKKQIQMSDADFSDEFADDLALRFENETRQIKGLSPIKKEYETRVTSIHQNQKPLVSRPPKQPKLKENIKSKLKQPTRLPKISSEPILQNLRQLQQAIKPDVQITKLPIILNNSSHRPSSLATSGRSSGLSRLNSANGPNFSRQNSPISMKNRLNSRSGLPSLINRSSLNRQINHRVQSPVAKASILRPPSNRNLDQKDSQNANLGRRQGKQPNFAKKGKKQLLPPRLRNFTDRESTNSRQAVIEHLKQDLELDDASRIQQKKLSQRMERLAEPKQTFKQKIANTSSRYQSAAQRSENRSRRSANIAANRVDPDESSESRKRRIEKEEEALERKNRHKKFDFANFLNREAEHESVKEKKYQKAKQKYEQMKNQGKIPMTGKDISEPEKVALKNKGSLWEEFGRDFDSSRNPEMNFETQINSYSRERDGPQYKDPPAKAGKAPRQIKQAPTVTQLPPDRLTALVNEQETDQRLHAINHERSQKDAKPKSSFGGQFDRQMQLAAKANLSLKNLRELEHAAAIKIQRMVRMAMTRKSYLDFTIRQRLSIPFSALDFAQNPFLRQFSRLNQKIHQKKEKQQGILTVQKDESNKRERLVQSRLKHKNLGKPGLNSMTQAEERSQLHINLLKNKRRVLQESDGVDLPMNLFEKPSQNSNQNNVHYSKGMTPDELIDVLTDDMLNNGLDALGKFKRLGAGIDYSDDGLAYALDDKRRFLDARLAEQRREKQIGTVDQSIGVVFLGGNQNIEAGNAAQETEIYLQNLRKQDLDEGQRANNENTSATMRGHLVRMEGFTGQNNIHESEENEEKSYENDIDFVIGDQFERNKKKSKVAVDQFQAYSREPIVFTKHIGQASPIKWTAIVGNAFFKSPKHFEADQSKFKLFIPIKLIGNPLGFRSQVMQYSMNLEVLKISDSSLRNKDIQTIWPVILYLFNNWIRHQFLLQQVKSVLPELRDVTSDDYSLPDLLLKAKQKGQSVDQENDGEFDDQLNFSSELEIDPRFDGAEEKLSNLDLNVIDRSRPQHSRLPAKAMRREARSKVFQSYKEIIRQEEDKAARDAQITHHFRRLKNDKDNNNAISSIQKKAMNGQQIKALGKETSATTKGKIRSLINKIGSETEKSKKGKKVTIDETSLQNKFAEFLNSQTAPLPKDNSNQWKLILSLQDDVYAWLNKKGGLNKNSVSLMNEERRKQQGLPPLSTLDYNCIDRASIKLRLVIDTLQVVRQLNGVNLVSRDMILWRKLNDYSDRRHKIYPEIAAKRQNLSIQILKIYGPNVQIAPAYNPQAVVLHQAGAHLISKSTMHQHSQQDRQNQNFSDKQLSANSVSISNVDEDDSMNLGQLPDTGLVNGLGGTTRPTNMIMQESQGASNVPQQTPTRQKSLLKVKPSLDRQKSESVQKKRSVQFNLKTDQTEQKSVFDEDALDKELLENQEAFKFIPQKPQIFRSSPLKEKINKMPYIGQQDATKISAAQTKTQDFSQKAHDHQHDIILEVERENEQDQKNLVQELQEQRREVEQIMEDGRVLEQGCIRFDGRVFVANLLFRKIESNIATIVDLINKRESKYKNNDDVELQQNELKTFQIMDKPVHAVRLTTKACDIVSDDPKVLARDDEIKHILNDQSKLVDVQIEMQVLPHTDYISYCEFKLFTRISATIWDDTINLRWEDLCQFFAFFGHNFDPISFLKRESFTARERYLFYTYATKVFVLDPERGVLLTLKLDNLDQKSLFYEKIYLDLARHQYEKKRNRLNYFTEDILKEENVNFDQSLFDEISYPFFQDANKIRRKDFRESLMDQYQKVQSTELKAIEEQQEIGLTMNVEPKEDDKFQEGDKPEILVDDNTQEFIADPNNLFNLTLSKYPREQTVFAGKLFLKAESALANTKKKFKYLQFSASDVKRNQEFISTVEDKLILHKYKKLNLREGYQTGLWRSQARLQFEAGDQISPIDSCAFNDLYNVKIEYYVHGVVPKMEIKAWSSINGLFLTHRITSQKQIKQIIRICGQESNQMVNGQLQSLICVGQGGLHGSSLRLNFNKQKDRQKQNMQDLFTLIVFNEEILSKRIGKNNVTKFKQVINLANQSQESSSSKEKKSVVRSLASVVQFEIETELMSDHGNLMMQLVYGNKHLTREQILFAHQGKDLQKSMKMHQIVHLWKISLFNMKTCQTLQAILTQRDIEDYYEAEIFAFFRQNPQLSRPSLMDMIKEYLTNLMVIRTQVGSTLAWNLPAFKKPIDKDGNVIQLAQDQFFRLKELSVYSDMRKLIKDAQNSNQEESNLPLSLDQIRADKKNARLPTLGLKQRQIIEKVLPIYKPDDFRTLKITSLQHRIVTQASKLFDMTFDESKELGPKKQFTLITVTQHETLECWIWTIYVPFSQRTFMVTLFASDLFNIDQSIFKQIKVLTRAAKKRQPKDVKSGFKIYGEEEILWRELIKRSHFEQNKLGDILLVIDQIREPLREQLYQSYSYEELARDIFYMEVTVKTYSNYVTHISGPFNSFAFDDPRGQDLALQIRLFSMARRKWLKDQIPLHEVVRQLTKDGLLHPGVHNFYFSMLRNAAVMTAHKMIFRLSGQEGSSSSHGGDGGVSRALEKAFTKQAKQSEVKFEIRDLVDRVVQEEKKEAFQGVDPSRLERATFVSKATTEWQDIVQLSRVIFQQVVAKNPLQIATVTYNEAKNRFLYRLYRPQDSTTIERRFDGIQIQTTCAPHYLHMLRNQMDQELGERICRYFHSNILIASVMEKNQLKPLADGYKALSEDVAVLTPKKAVFASKSMRDQTLKKAQGSKSPKRVLKRQV